MSEMVRFVGAPLKLGTSSARIRLLHYMEGERYQLSPVLQEVSLKVSKQVYPGLLSRLKARWLIFTVTGNTVTSVEPLRNLQPDPAYYVSFEDGDIQITSSGKIIRTIRDKLIDCKYEVSHAVGTDRHVLLSCHMIGTDLAEWRDGSRCGCCLTLTMRSRVTCPYRDCNYTFKRVKGYPLAFWLRHTHDAKGSFDVTVDLEEVITTDAETGLTLRATITDIINSLIVEDWKPPGRVEALVDSMKVSKP